jgi:hypothetical protein
MTEIRPKERDAVIQSLRAGVVPRLGQHLIQVGRVKEVEALLKDIDRVIDGGSTIRFVIGEYGSGKTFFLNLIRAIALEKRLITVHADLSPDKRLQSTGGQARSLYAELMRNVSTRSKPDGGAIQNIVERFITEAIRESQSSGIKVESIILRRLEKIYEMVGGYDFAQVISAYWKGHDTCNEQLKSDAIRWLRGEFSTKTEAKLALGVRTIIDDMSVYDHLKLMAIFVRLAGYNGLLICLDELVNLYKLANSQSRNANYEQILRMVNDSLQGIAVGLGIIMGGTPEFLMDTRRGLYSYPALQSRLAENTFATGGRLDFTGPVLRLSSLSQEDFFVLITKVRHVYALGNPEAYLLPDEGLKAFMEYSFKKIGEIYFCTPRNTIKAFVNLLAVLEQNKDLKWQEMLGNVEIDREANPDLEPLPVDVDTIQSSTNNERQQQDGGDNLRTFKL